MLFIFLHYMLGFPDNGVSVKVSGGVKPQIKLLLPVSLALSEYIGVYNIRVTTNISQEFKVDFIMS